MSRIASLALLDPGFREAVQGVLDELDRNDIPLLVFESIRSPGRQTSLYGRGRNPSAPDFGRTVTKARAYQSAHQFGLAVDLVFLVDGEWTWEEPEGGMWASFHDIARGNGCVPLSFEQPHIQVAGFDWRTLERGTDNDSGWLQWLRVRNGPDVT